MAKSAAEAMRCQTHNVSQNDEQSISSQNAWLCQKNQIDHSKDNMPRATSTSRATLIPTSFHTFHEQSDVGTSYQDS